MTRDFTDLWGFVRGSMDDFKEVAINRTYLKAKFLCLRSKGKDMAKDWNGRNRRRWWTRIKMKYKMPLFIGVPTLILMIATSTVSFFSARSALTAQQDVAFEQLLLDKADRLKNWLEGVETDINLLSEWDITRNAITQFSQGWDELGADAESMLQDLYITSNPNPNGEKDLLQDAEDGSNWSQVHAQYHSDFRSFQRGREYYDLFLFDLNGDMIYSVFKELDFATNFNTGVYADSGLGEVYRGARNLPRGEMFVTDFAAYAPSYGAAAKFIAMPVFDSSGTRIGVVALQLPVDEIAQIISNSSLLGETGQIYAVGADGRARSGSIFEDGHALLEALPKLEQIDAVIAGEERRFHNVVGLNGEQVIAFTHVVGSLDTKWHLILEQDEAEASLAANRLLTLANVQTLAVMVLIGLLAYFIARGLTRRIYALADSVNGIAQGDFDSLVNQTKTGDELGDIARAIEKFKSELAQGQEAMNGRIEAAEQQSQVMKRLGDALDQLSQGQLECSLNEKFPDGFEELRQNFNKTVRDLALIISKLKRFAGVIDSDARAMNESAHSLSQRTENQAATLEETAAAMDQISSSVKDTAEGAKNIAKFVGTVQSQAELSERVGLETHKAMTNIENSSKQISAIVQLIDDIAFQTNLLALNAGVEAARAGEAGLGFSVVASEVRALSQRSSENAAQIRELINESSDGVAEGVKLTNEMSDAIKNILGGVAEVAGSIQSIAQSAEEQSLGLSEINTGIAMLDRVTQENAALVDQSASSSTQLQQRAAEMNVLVARFREGGAAQDQIGRTREPAAPHDELKRAS